MMYVTGAKIPFDDACGRNRRAWQRTGNAPGWPAGKESGAADEGVYSSGLDLGGGPA